MGVLLALCLAVSSATMTTTAAAAQTAPRTYSSPIRWSPSIRYAKSYYGNAKKKFILVYVGDPREKREPRPFQYREAVNADRGAWLFVDVNYDPDDPQQKRWGVKRASTTVGCDIHGNAFQVLPSLSRPGLQRLFAVVPLLQQKYEAKYKRDLEKAVEAIDKNPDKAVKELVRLAREGLPGYKDVTTALAKLEEIAKPELAQGELAESVSLDQAVEFYSDFARRFEGTPPGVRALLRKAQLEAKRGRFDEAVAVVRTILDLDPRRFPKLQASASKLLREIPAGPIQPAPASGRRPVPAGPHLARAARLYRELIAPPADPGDRAAVRTFAAALLAEGAALTDRPAGAYYLLDEARETAAKAADPATATRAIRALATRFETDGHALTLRTLKAMAALKLTEAESSAVAAAHLDHASKIVRTDPDAAMKLLETAGPLARQAKDLSLIGRISGRIKTVKTFQAEAARMKPFEAKLAADPDDATANLEVGRYRCFFQRNWDEGLPMLVKGGDAALREAAEADLAGPADAAGQVAVADRWWSLADAHPATRASLLIRAGTWYIRTWPAAQGLEKLKIEQRIQRIALDAPEAGLAIPSVKVHQPAAWAAIAPKYPKSADTGAHGTATASSQYSTRNPENVFGAVRNGTAWSLNGDDGWFSATWDPAATGRFIVLFGRSVSTPGNCPWGEATISVNGNPPLAVTGMAGGYVALVDLGVAVQIRSLEIRINGDNYPGLAAVEIHP